MQRPIDVRLPHQLGKAEARRRIAANIGSLKDHIPGGSAHVTSAWVGDRLDLKVSALGQQVDARLEVEESHVRCHVLLPGMLAMFAGPIEAMLNRKGGDVLLEDKRKD